MHFLVSSHVIAQILWWLCFFLKRRSIRIGVSSVIGVLFLGETLLTPGVVSFRAYRLIDNEPIAQPVGIMPTRDTGLLHLADGRVIKFDRRADWYDVDNQIGLEEVSNAGRATRYRVLLKRPRYDLGFVYAKHYLRIPLVTTIVGKNEAAEIGHGTVLPPDWRADNELLLRGIRKPVQCGYKARPEWIKELLERGADPNCVGSIRGDSPLHWAANTEVGVARALIEAGARVEAVDSKGRTPLHVAATRNFDVTQLLVRSGADIHAKDVKGLTPLAMAREHLATGPVREEEIARIVKYLEQKEAQGQHR
ncbi:MAG: ankyrin repeat domain-containing protein [Planctomycetota bacterium]|jgi:hypothetical protein